MSTAIIAVKSTLRDRRNWYIHQCYVRQDFTECLRVIEEHLRECRGLCEFPLYIKALIMRHQGRVEESLVLLQAAACLNPQNIGNLKQVARSLYLLGKHKAAIDVFDEAWSMSPDQWDVLYNKGMCYMYLRQYDNGIECFEQATAVQATYMQLGRAYVLQSKFKEALRVYSDAMEFNPEDSELLTTVGLLHLRMGNNQKAFELLGNSLTYNPTNPKTILAAGSIIQDNQDMDVALVKYRVAVIKTPNCAQLWNNIGMCLFGKTKYVAAVSCLKKALYLAPFEWIINYNLGVVYLATEQYVSAFHHYSAAINLNPTYAPSLMYLAVALAYLDEFENACAAYEKSISIADTYVTRLNYAITLYRNDEIERAASQYSRFELLLAGLEHAQVDDQVTHQASLLRNALK